tara:strand:+ start:254 stop:478 length:225 start_codon:yes stop_codon:yes gene_type:complete
MSKADTIHDNRIEDIIQSIRDLRDADFHVCNYSEWQSKGEPDTTDDITCSCNEFDAVIDKLEELKYNDNENKKG